MSKKRNNKEKGSMFERKIAKELSLWLFQDKNLLRRHPDSGAFKGNYTGDLCPANQLPEQWNSKWPFQVECKYGYKSIAIPTIWNKKWITEWYLKSLDESKKHNQQIIFIINNFLNRQFNTITTDILLPTNLILHEMSYPIIINGFVTHLFIYNYKKVLSYDFQEIFPNFFEVYCRLCK